MSEKLDYQKIADKYNKIETIWDKKDQWHWNTFQMIIEFISKHTDSWAERKYTILNAGSGGNSYELPLESMVHMDIANKKIANIPNSIVASIEDIPFADRSFDTILCVGSVINYCDPIRSIQEFSRTLKVGGQLILEFENSKTLELLASKDYNKNAVLVDTFYKGEETIWFYSEKFILEVLKENNLVLQAKDSCHILSPFVYRLTNKANFAAYFAKLDCFLKHLPFFRKVSSNIILLAQKSM